MARIVLNPFGSFGDLHPFLALALELRKRGHMPCIATAGVYRAKVMAEGIDFAAVQPDVGSLLETPEKIQQVLDPRRGAEYLLKKVILPCVEQSFEELSAICQDADLILTHTAGYAGPIAAEYLGKKWLSVALQPMVFFSAYEPPVLAPAIWLKHFYRLGSLPFRIVRWMARRTVQKWVGPISQLRKRLGLPDTANPVFEGQFSPHGTLALFSRQFAEAQPDWPPNVKVTGFAFYDKRGMELGGATADGGERLTPELNSFLETGREPIVFTLGSSAVMQPGRFFEESAEAADRLGMRAVLLLGPQGNGGEQASSVPGLFKAEYAPYSALLPRAAATVHSGGIGTTAQALRAGKPMLIVPWAHDQPDNAERARKLGVARTLGRSRYTAARAARQIEELLHGATYTQRAAALGRQIRAENGAASASDHIEAVLRTRATR